VEKVEKLAFLRILLLLSIFSAILQTFCTFSQTFGQVLDSTTVNASDPLSTPVFPPLARERPFVLGESEDVDASPGGGNVILLSQRYNEEEFSNEIVGEVENKGTEPVEYVKVAVTFYDGSGNVVGTENTYANPSDLAPGMKSPFKILISNDSVIEVIETSDFTISWDNADGSSGMNIVSGNFSNLATKMEMMLITVT
jgi:hypothetical protein